MELEFDKEIDALMRGELTGQIKSGETLNAHPDADEISAFAENAMPEKTRALHMTHLAECDRCRRILSNLIVLNSEAAPQTAAVTAPAIRETAVPWYRRLLLFPNLAYVMGALVLVFGGLLSFTLLRNLGGEATVSQSTEMPVTARGPMAQTEPDYSASNSMSNTASVAANANSAAAPGIASSDAAANSAPLGTALAPPAPVTEEKMETRDVAGFSLDGTSAGKPAETAPAAAAPPPAKAAVEQPKDADLARVRKEEDRQAEAEKSDAVTDAVTVTADDAKKRSARSKQANETQLRSQAGGPIKAKPGPSRDSQQNFPNRADNTFEMPTTRTAGGKTFNLRSGAWYDTAFRGQPAINIRRGSDEYRKLDGGLRSIAESISGTVVVVWGAKAYRIQ